MHPSFDARSVARMEADVASGGNPLVRYVDLSPVFVGADGRYDQYLSCLPTEGAPQGCGAAPAPAGQIQVRNTDGQHFCVVGHLSAIQPGLPRVLERRAAPRPERRASDRRLAAAEQPNHGGGSGRRWPVGLAAANRLVWARALTCQAGIGEQVPRQLGCREARKRRDRERSLTLSVAAPRWSSPASEGVVNPSLWVAVDKPSCASRVGSLSTVRAGGAGSRANAADPRWALRPT